MTELGTPGAVRSLLAGVAAGGTACLGMVAIALVRYPGVVSGPRTWLALLAFVGLLACYLAGALAAAPGLASCDAPALRLAVFGGLAVAASWMLVGLTPLVVRSPLIAGVLLLGGPLIALAIGVVAASLAGRRLGVGLVGFASVVAGLVSFLLWVGDTVVTGGRPYDSAMVRDFRSSGASDLATYAVNDSLGSAMVLLVLVPLVTVLAGSLGVALVTARAARRTA